MKRILLFLAFSVAFFQQALAQQTLAQRLPELKLPLVLDSTFKAEPVTLSREELWNELIRPMEKLMKGKFEKFPVDSASIDKYRQWENLNLEKMEDYIPYTSPPTSGMVYVFGKVSLPGTLTGWLWGLDQAPSGSGRGTTWFLVCRKMNGDILKYQVVYQNLKEGAPAESYGRYLYSALKPGTMRSTALVQKLVNGKKSGKPVKSVYEYTIGEEGILKKTVN